MQSERGTAMVEFVIVAPVFLFTIFMILELSLMWVDKHYLRYALFDAGRILSTSVQANPCIDEPLFIQSRNRAVLRMAAVAPTIERLNAILPGTSTKATTQSQSINNGGLGKMLWYVVARLPGSMLSLQLQCRIDPQDPHGFTLSARYLRLAQMPMIGRVLSLASQFKDKYEQGSNNVFIGQNLGVLQSWLAQPLFSRFLGENSWSTSAPQLAIQFAKMSEALNNLPVIVPINLSWRFEVFSHRAQPQQWEDGRALAVAPFNPKGFGEGWRLWSQQLSR